VDRAAFKNRLLSVMERKDHWAWPMFTGGQVPKEKLHIHFEQEWATYVRDFPVLVGWAYVQCPVVSVRQALAANVYEEETGGLSGGRPHPELFLEYPKGLGMDLSRFERVTLLPGAASYRAILDETTRHRGWAAAAAVTTIFVEGTRYERGELDADAEKRPEVPLTEHPLVRHYGLPVEHLALTKVHRAVEGGHRKDAWDAMLDHVGESDRPTVIEAMEEVLDHWLDYRDDVAEAVGLAE